MISMYDICELGFCTNLELLEEDFISPVPHLPWIIIGGVGEEACVETLHVHGLNLLTELLGVLRPLLLLGDIPPECLDQHLIITDGLDADSLIGGLGWVLLELHGNVETHPLGDLASLCLHHPVHHGNCHLYRVLPCILSGDVSEEFVEHLVTVAGGGDDALG